MRAKTFHISQLMSVYHNKLFCSFDEMRELLDYMIDWQVPLWDVPRARAACAASLVRQYPWLAQIDMPTEFRKDHSQKITRRVAKAIGTDAVEVRPLQSGTYHATPFAKIYGYR